jgi:hypothetical protein
MSSMKAFNDAEMPSSWPDSDSDSDEEMESGGRRRLHSSAAWTHSFVRSSASYDPKFSVNTNTFLVRLGLCQSLVGMVGAGS